MEYFVVYMDDYADNGGFGLESFESKEDAIAFIEQRMAQDCDRKLPNYTLIEGKILPLKAVEVVTKIQA